MGIFYVNHTVRAPQPHVIAVLKKEGRTAFVSPTFNGYTVICDRQCDDQDPVAIAQLGQKLSAQLESPALAVLNHDDAILCYWLFEQGRLIEEYDSFPDCFEDEDDESDDDWPLWQESFWQGEAWKANGVAETACHALGNGEALCRVFGRPALQEQVQWVLAGHDTFFAQQIHQELVRILGLPPCSLGAGYKCVAQRYTELDRDACVHVGRQAPDPFAGHQRSNP